MPKEFGATAVPQTGSPNASTEIALQSELLNTDQLLEASEMLSYNRSQSDPTGRSSQYAVRNHYVASTRPVADLTRYLIGEISTQLHGSCPRCHRWHNRVEYKFNPRQYNRIICQNTDCRHVIFGLGGNASHESFMSQWTITPLRGLNQQQGPRSEGPPALTLAMSRRSSGGLDAVQESQLGLSLANEVLPPEDQADTTVCFEADTKLKPVHVLESVNAVAKPSIAGPNEKLVDGSADEFRSRVRFGAGRDLLRKFQFQFPFKFRPPIKRRKIQPSTDAAARYNAGVANAVGDTSSKPSPEQHVIDSNQANIANPQRAEQALHLSADSTLKSSPEPTRPGTVSEGVMGPRNSTDLRETSDVTKELSAEEANANRRAAIRQKKTDDAIGNSCICMQAGSNDANAASSPRGSHSEPDGRTSRARSDTTPLDIGNSDMNFYYQGIGGRYFAQRPARDSLQSTSTSSSGRADSNHFSIGHGSNGRPNYQYSALSRMSLPGSVDPPVHFFRSVFTPSPRNSESPALSDRSYAIMSSPRSQSPSGADHHDENHDQASGREYQTPPQSPSLNQGERTPTQEHH